MSKNETTGGSRRWCEAWPTGVLAMTAWTGALVLLTAACGGSTGAASTGAASTGAASTASASFTSRLAYVRCVRAHGVPNFPDPDSQGLEPAGTKQLFMNDPQMRTASDACRHLLPNGGHPTQSPQANALTEAQALRLAGCMRTHGLPMFPDPTIDSVGQPVFNVRGAGIAPQSPHVLATLRGCLSLLHITGIPQATT